tara:strand:+ start:1843 stop:2202 length:360 start_codon:yes stop_codon:yes gene_type:complete
MDCDSICEQLSDISIHQKVSTKLLTDLNLILSEIINVGHYNIDIYELCVDCGNSLTWDQEYNLSEFDIKWLKTSGKVYFYETLNDYISIDTSEKLNLVDNLFEKLIELFSIQLGNENEK